MAYPSSTSYWDGYLVIQSKFHIRSEGVQKDGQWAITQLREELKKFQSARRNLRKPDYYLLVTNVVLTPQQGTGTKDKLLAVLEDQAPALGLRGYDVWDHDKLCRLLDANESIKTNYAAFITSGDVLAAMARQLHNHQPDFEQVISGYLQHELLADQYVRLEQAGHDPQHKTLLAQVFVDLPASTRPLTEATRTSEKITEPFQGVVAEILNIGSRVLKPSCAAPSDDDPQDRGVRGDGAPELGRFVLVGGPGQGKSTVGQFICQVYRATILRERPLSALAREAQTTLHLFDEQCQSDRLDLPQVPRFPVRIVLDQFATALAQHEVKSLLSFIAGRLNASDHACSVDDLRRWLRTYPWLIVLDGLDEVPATSNRQQVLEKVTDFWSEIATQDADVLVVATTRPQGYNDDFSPRHYYHRYLTPLSPAHALRYAKRLVEARYHANPDQQDRVMRRLRMACDQETTQRLMRSPLQVTIMATLVDRIGQPPQERWRLFRQYYEVIYQRETEREILASVILQQRRADVNVIHYRVGLALQTESERAGATDSQMDVDRFDLLVRARIAQKGHEGVRLDRRAREITDAALNRLVFLVGLQRDRIGFEVRSLQEFMAAEALMEGTDEQVKERLEAIAPIAHWRNVFLFAAGKCFAERQIYRDMIFHICEQLNQPDNDKLANVTLTGSRLALDILDEGVAREVPKYARSLAGLALRLMSLPDARANLRLGALYDEELDKLYRQEVEQRLEDGHARGDAGVWPVLAVLIERDVQWATDLAEKHWPRDREEQYRALEHSFYLSDSEWVQAKRIDFLIHASPRGFPRTEIRREGVPEPDQAHLPDWYRVASELFNSRRRGGDAEIFSLNSLFTGRKYVRLALHTPVNSTPQHFLALRDVPSPHHPSWAPYVSAARFAANPNSATLAQELSWLSKAWNPPISEPSMPLIKRFAWPLAACISACRNKDDLATFAARAQTGGFGKREDWEQAERRWRYEGVTVEDIQHMTDDRWPYDHAVAHNGFPWECGSLFIPERNLASLWTALWGQFETLPSGRMRTWIAQEAYDAISFRQWGRVNSPRPTPQQLRCLLIEMRAYERGFLGPALILKIGLPKDLDAEWLGLLDWWGRHPSFLFGRVHRSLSFTRQVVQAFIDNPEHLGLIGVLAQLILPNGPPQVPAYLLDEHRFPNDDLKCAALLVDLAQKSTTLLPTANVVGQYTRLLREYPPIGSFALFNLIERNVHGPHAENFALALNESLDLEARQQSSFADFLNYLMRSRTSRLVQPKQWRALGLPEIE